MLQLVNPILKQSQHAAAVLLQGSAKLAGKTLYANWLEMERYRNGIQPRPNNPLATYTEARPEFQPGSQKLSFDLPLFKLPKENCTVYEGPTLSSCLAKKYLGFGQVQFAVHPQTAETPTVPHVPVLETHEKELAPVAPTASSRTVFSLEDELAPHCLKLHFPFQITRSKRSLDKNTIRHSIAVSNLLLRSKVAERNPWMALFPESLGVSFGDDQNGWGFLIREMEAYPLSPIPRSIYPFFALYSPDIRTPRQLPLLCNFINNAEEEPRDFILDRLFYPLLQGWVDVFKATGVILEAHGQNSCVEVDHEGNFGRIVFRDFDTYVCEERLKKLGYSHEGILTFKNSGTDTKPQGSVFSLLYDQAMRVPFDRIAEVAETHYGVKKTDLQQKCRVFLRDIFPEGDTFFPKARKVYNYVENRVVAPGMKTLVQETGQPPAWR